MGAKPRRAVGPSRLMHMIRTIAEADKRSVRDAVERTALGKSAWQKWLHGGQPMVFQQLEQVLENYGYVLMPVPMGPEATAAKAAFLASVNRGAAATSPVDPVEEGAGPVENRGSQQAEQERDAEHDQANRKAGPVS